MEAAQAYHSIRASGYHARIEYDMGVWTVVPSKNPVGTKIVSVRDLGPHDGNFVYDFTTENHHFQAGVGCMIVHNTDSVMVEFDVQVRDMVAHLLVCVSRSENAGEDWHRSDRVLVGTW